MARSIVGVAARLGPAVVGHRRRQRHRNIGERRIGVDIGLIVKHRQPLAEHRRLFLVLALPPMPSTEQPDGVSATRHLGRQFVLIVIP